MRTTRRLLSQIGKIPTTSSRFVNVALMGAGGVAAVLTTNAAYQSYKDHQLHQATHEKMQEVKSNLRTFEDLLTELRKPQTPSEYALFWKYLYFNMHRHLLTSTRDYGTLLLEVNRFIEEYFFSHTYSSNVARITAIHDEIIDIILANMVKEKLSTQDDLYELLDTIAIANEKRTRYYNTEASLWDDDYDASKLLPYEDFQAVVVKRLLPLKIDGIFVDNAGMNQILKCNCISENTKQLLLNNPEISARYFANIGSYQDFNLLLQRSAPENIAVLMKHVTSNKSALANLKTSLNSASMDDIKAILTNLRDAKYDFQQTGANQKHFLQALGSDHPVVAKVRENMHALVASKHLLLDATLFLNSTNKETYCDGRVSFRH